MVLGEQDVATILPHYLNGVENTPPLTLSTPESFITASVKTEESSSSLAVNETQTLDTTCVENKSAASSESSMAGSPDTESPVLVNEYVRIFPLRYIQEKLEAFFYFSVMSSLQSCSVFICEFDMGIGFFVYFIIIVKNLIFEGR